MRQYFPGVLGAGLVVVGVLVLAGVGWALVAAGALVLADRVFD